MHNINARDERCNAPLMLAAAHSHIKVVRFLLQKGAQANLSTNEGQTALMLAETKRHTEIVQLLKASDALQ